MPVRDAVAARTPSAAQTKDSTERVAVGLVRVVEAVLEVVSAGVAEAMGLAVSTPRQAPMTAAILLAAEVVSVMLPSPDWRMR